MLDKAEQMDNPCSSWLTDSCWDNVTELDKLPNFHGIMATFEQYTRDWNLWFTSSEPENTALPGRIPVSFLLGTIRLKCADNYLYLCDNYQLLSLPPCFFPLIL